jgi:predicted RND superfamily exporter protein
VVTGAPVLEDVLVSLLEHDMVRVTVASAIVVALLLAIYYRRFRPWLAVMLPLLLAWVGFAAALAACRLPLNLYNLLSVPLVIGYGIDDLVFLVHRYEAEPERGTGAVLATTGRAIVLTSLSTMAGFAGLAVARFDGLRLLGLSGALAVALCLIAAFAVLPAMLTLLTPRDKPRG